MPCRNADESAVRWEDSDNDDDSNAIELTGPSKRRHRSAKQILLIPGGIDVKP